jgi:hypothetical protein
VLHAVPKPMGKGLAPPYWVRDTSGSFADRRALAHPGTDLTSSTFPRLCLSVSFRVHGPGSGNWNDSTVYDLGCVPAGCVGLAHSASVSLSFLHYKMECLLPSHKVFVKVTGATMPVPSCLRVSLPRIISLLPPWPA